MISTCTPARTRTVVRRFLTAALGLALLAACTSADDGLDGLDAGADAQDGAATDADSTEPGAPDAGDGADDAGGPDDGTTDGTATDDPDGADDDPWPAHSTIIQGPLCLHLPGDDDPGGPTSLVDETADVALEWIPVLSIFEAAARATGLDEMLRTSDGITLLAPTDDAFDDVLDEQTLDDLILLRQDELQALLEAHLVDGEYALADLVDDGMVTTRSGEQVAVVQQEDAVVLDGIATVTCADYETSNARIHIIDAVRGTLPPQSPERNSDSDTGN